MPPGSPPYRQKPPTKKIHLLGAGGKFSEQGEEAFLSEQSTHA